MPELYRNAWYAQLKKKVDELQEEIEKAIELPSVTSADEGKVLTVDNDGKWNAEDVPKELPVVQTTDEGKVLTVDNNGQWVANILLSTNYSTDEKVVGTWLDGEMLYQKSIIIDRFPSSDYHDTDSLDYKYLHPIQGVINDGYYQKIYDINIQNLGTVVNVGSVLYEKDASNNINPRIIELNGRPVGASDVVPFGFVNSNGQLTLRTARSTVYPTTTYLIITIQYIKTSD